MPLYEYECLNCGKRTEVIQRFADAPLATCPKCGGEVKKLISAPAVQFKGSGWYVTDYASKKGGDSDSKTDKADKTEAKSGGDSDAKADKPKEAAAAESKSSPAASSSSGSGSSGSSE